MSRSIQPVVSGQRLYEAIEELMGFPGERKQKQGQCGGANFNVQASREVGDEWRTRWLLGQWLERVLETDQYVVSGIKGAHTEHFDEWVTDTDQWEQTDLEPPPVLDWSWYHKINEAKDGFEYKAGIEGPWIFQHKTTGIRIVSDNDWFAVANTRHYEFAELAAKSLKVPHFLKREHNEEALNKVVWDAQTRNLTRDVKFFVGNPDWFKLRGLPYKRSYLLYGPPGNGKTSSIRAVADYLHLDFDTYDLCSPQASDEEFVEWLTKGGRRNRIRELFDIPDEDESKPEVKRILVLEDIDRFFEGGNVAKEARVSKSALLNGLDGAVPIHETILFATANHPENLDQTVVARPGRFDLRVHYSPPDPDHALMLLSKLFEHDPEVTAVGLHQACKAMAGHSYALHKSVLVIAGSIASVDECESITDEHLEEAVSVAMGGAQVLHGSTQVGFK